MSFFLFHNTSSSHSWPRRKDVYGWLPFTWLKLGCIFKESSRTRIKVMKSMEEGGAQRRETSMQWQNMKKERDRRRSKRRDSAKILTDQRQSQASEEREDHFREHFGQELPTGIFEDLVNIWKMRWIIRVLLRMNLPCHWVTVLDGSFPWLQVNDYLYFILKFCEEISDSDKDPNNQQIRQGTFCSHFLLLTKHPVYSLWRLLQCFPYNRQTNPSEKERPVTSRNPQGRGSGVGGATAAAQLLNYELPFTNMMLLAYYSSLGCIFQGH